MMTASMCRLRHRRNLIDFNFEKYPQKNKKRGSFLKKILAIFPAHSII